MKRRLSLLTTLAALGCVAPQQTPVDRSKGSTEDSTASSTMQGMQDMTMEGEGLIRISARQAALAGVTFAVAREAPLERTVRAVAMAVPNERNLGIVNTRVTGWIERLHVNETGQFVQAGEPLFELYAPDLVAAQEEFLLAQRLGSMAGGNSLLAAARRRLALWGISEEEIAGLERTGEVKPRLVIRSPYTGHVLEKNLLEGQMVRPGERLYRIADLSTIWIEPAVFEQDIPLVRAGQRADVQFDALPGRSFRGRVNFLYPELDPRTRTLRVRIEVPNPRFEIRPGMYGTARIEARAPRGVIVPLAAVLPTGEQDLAFVFRGGGVVPTPVVVAQRGDSTIMIANGLAAGDTIVASATFLFDSESQLAAAMAGIMLSMGMGLDMGGMEMEGDRR